MEMFGHRIRANIRRLSVVVDESGVFGGPARALVGLAPDQWRRRLLASSAYYRLVSARTASLIARNTRFRDLHRGQRAFIAATGPSLAEQELSALKGAVVISVNENFSYLKSRGVEVGYNVIQDHAYVDDLATYTGFWRDLAVAARNDGVVPVLPSTAARFVSGMPPWSGIDPAYFFQLGDFMLLDGGLANELDFSQPLPHQITVTHAAVAWAMYLGCAEINLLGVDLDYADDLERPMQHCYGDNPYFDYGRHSTRELFERHSRLRAEELRRHIERQQGAFDRLGAVTAARDQTLIDAGLRGRAGALPKRPLPQRRHNGHEDASRVPEAL
jgi:hypothetical protein